MKYLAGESLILGEGLGISLISAPLLPQSRIATANYVIRKQCRPCFTSSVVQDTLLQHWGNSTAFIWRGSWLEAEFTSPCLFLATWNRSRRPDSGHAGQNLCSDRMQASRHGNTVQIFEWILSILKSMYIIPRQSAALHYRIVTYTDQYYFKRKTFECKIVSSKRSREHEYDV